MEITGVLGIITATLALVFGLRQLLNHASKAQANHLKVLREVGHQLLLKEVQQPDAWLAFEGHINETILVLRTIPVVQARKTEIVTEVRCPTPTSVPAGFTVARSSVLGRLRCTLGNESNNAAILSQSAKLKEYVERFTEPLWAGRPGTGTIDSYGMCLRKSGTIEDPDVFHEMVRRTVDLHDVLALHRWSSQPTEA